MTRPDGLLVLFGSLVGRFAQDATEIAGDAEH
jgi:hypothetical protein